MAGAKKYIKIKIGLFCMGLKMVPEGIEFIGQIIHKFELNYSYIGDFFSSQKPMEVSKLRGRK